MVNRLDISRLVLTAFLLAAAGCGAARSPSPEYLIAGGNPALPFSPAVRVGTMLYLAGQVGTDQDGRLVAGGIREETRQTMTNIRQVLERNGSSLDRVVKCLVMLADIREWGAMSEEYVKFFPIHRPARSAFAGTGLALGARVEIECMAAVG